MPFLITVIEIEFNLQLMLDSHSDITSKRNRKYLKIIFCILLFDFNIFVLHY